MSDRGLHGYFTFGFSDYSTLWVYVYKKEKSNNEGSRESLEDRVPAAIQNQAQGL